MTSEYSRPSKGTLTRRVWDIADEETERRGSLADRRRVIERVVAEGGNQNTASTQYHHWRRHQEERSRSASPDSRFTDGINFQVELKDAGRVLLPANVRAALGIAEGDQMVGVVKDGELRLMSRNTAIRNLQARVRRYVPEGVSLVDQLIADRRADNARDGRS